MKIIFYLHSPTTYHFDFFKSLFKKKIDVYVIYQNKKINNFNWKFKKYKWVFYIDKNESSIKIKKLLKKIDPEVIIIGGYKMKLDNFFKKNKNYLIYYWLERLEKKSFLINFLRNLYIKYKVKKVDGILAIGTQAKQYYKKFHNKITDLQYSIECNRIDLSKKLYGLNFLFVGQLIKRKGLNLLVNTISKIKDKKFNFTIVGEGYLKYEIEKIKNKNFKYYNFLNKKKLSNIYKKNSILILPSKFDGWAVVVLEAMQNGLAIVSNKNVGSFNEYIKNGINGREITSSPNSLYNQIKFFEKNIKKIKKYGIVNRRIFVENLSNADIAAKNLQFFLLKNFIKD